MNDSVFREDDDPPLYDIRSSIPDLLRGWHEAGPRLTEILEDAESRARFHPETLFGTVNRFGDVRVHTQVRQTYADPHEKSRIPCGYRPSPPRVVVGDQHRPLRSPTESSSTAARNRRGRHRPRRRARHPPDRGGPARGPDEDVHAAGTGRPEHAQQIAGARVSETTKLYDRTADTVTVDETERIVI